MSEQDNVVKVEPTTPPVSETQAVVPEETTKPASGSQTPSELLLNSLKEEREKRRILEEEKRILEERLTASAPSDEYQSDEGKMLKKEIEDLRLKTKSFEDKLELERVYAQYPEIKEKAVEFESYRADYPRNKLENVAKLFLSEMGSFEPTRKGLEKSSGGPRVPITGGMSAEDVATLRKTNFRKWQEMVRKGQINIV